MVKDTRRLSSAIRRSTLTFWFSGQRQADAAGVQVGDDGLDGLLSAHPGRVEPQADLLGLLTGARPAARRPTIYPYGKRPRPVPVPAARSPTHPGQETPD